MPTEPYHSNDRSQRQLFTHARMVEDLLRGFIHEPWIDELDFSTLKPWPSDFISEDYTDERISDVIWEIRWGKRKLLVFILLEFQSKNSWFMAVRMMVYVGLFYQKLINVKKLKDGDSLPPVLPIVLYNGDAKWTPPVELAELIDAPVKSFATYRPSLRYVLLDEQRQDLGPLAGLENVVAAIFKLAQGPPPPQSGEIFRTLAHWLREPENQALRRELASWLRHIYLPSRGVSALEIPQIDDLQELVENLEATMQTWPEYWKMEGKMEGYREGAVWGEERGVLKGHRRGLEEGVRKGRRQGRQEGVRAGEAKVLARQLESKFGPLDPATRSRVKSASADQLLIWAERLLTAASLDAVFQP